jgi:hypothetical protein
MDYSCKHVHGNWPGELPEVHRWPYDYSKPGHEEDFVPQNVPMKPGGTSLDSKIFKMPFNLEGIFFFL